MSKTIAVEKNIGAVIRSARSYPELEAARANQETLGRALRELASQEQALLSQIEAFVAERGSVPKLEDVKVEVLVSGGDSLERYFEQLRELATLREQIAVRRQALSRQAQVTGGLRDAASAEAGELLRPAHASAVQAIAEAFRSLINAVAHESKLIAELEAAGLHNNTFTPTPADIWRVRAEAWAEMQRRNGQEVRI